MPGYQQAFSIGKEKKMLLQWLLGQNLMTKYSFGVFHTRENGFSTDVRAAGGLSARSQPNGLLLDGRRRCIEQTEGI